ncbi:MAG TPA: adenylate/guanylate cyclase domain-containing protein [Candidatus Limnocylindria bacterium]
MASLSASARAKLPASAFAYIDSTGRRLLPIHDEAHVRNALARFSRIEFESEDARDKARSRLLRAAKKHRLVPVGFIDHELRPERRLPTGQVTLLFVDVEDSTRHLAELEDRYGPMLTAVRRLVRTAVRRAGGHEVDARADEFFAAFSDPAAALATARSVRDGIANGAWPDGRAVRVRVGLHVGRPTLTATGYVGIAVNTASRICAFANGGQIVASRQLRAALDDQASAVLASIGSHRLRGIPDELELFELRG